MSENPNDTMLKFQYPQSLVKEYGNWVVLVRPKQATLGALVLACKESAQAFSAISPAAFAELPRAIGDIETGLKAFRPYEKINYLMLMMVDNEVHYHVLPRYGTEQEFEGRSFQDPGWPALPELGSGPELTSDELAHLTAALQSVWPN